MKKIIFMLCFFLIQIAYAQPNYSYRKGILLYNKGFIYQSVPYFIHAVKNKKNIEAQIKLVKCYYLLGDYTNCYKALQKYFKSINSLNKELATIYFNTLAHFEYIDKMGQLMQNNYIKSLLNDSLSNHFESVLNNLSKIPSTSIRIENLAAVNTKYNEKNLSKIGSSFSFASDRAKIWIEPKNRVTGCFEFTRYSLIPQLNFKGGLIIPNTTGKFLGPIHLIDTIAYISRLEKDTNTNEYFYKLYKQNNGKTKSELSFIFNNEACSFTHPFIDSTNAMLFFSSDRKGGYGGFDIYVCIKTKSIWSDPINLGPTINTSGNDIAPFYTTHQCLYFSTNGNSGYGGYDIYKSCYIEGAWTKPELLDCPINSGADDIEYFEIANLKIITSNRPKGIGGYDFYLVK